MNPASITKEQWVNILKDGDVTTEKVFGLLRLIYSCDDYRATAGQLSHMLNIPNHNSLNPQVGRFGRRILEKLDISAAGRQSEGWWHVPFEGEDSKDGFYWILRPNLVEAIREITDVGFLS